MESTAAKNVQRVAADEDAWVYTAEHLAAVRRSQGQRGYRIGPDDLEKLIAEAEAAHRAGREYHVSEAELAAMEAAHGGKCQE